MTRYEKIRYILTPAVGFGIGGALWGWECYRGTIGAGETITNPFSFILGAVYLGIFGSASLVLFSGDIKKIVKVVLLGIGGWIVGFLVSVMLGYNFFLVSSAFLSFLLAPLSILLKSMGASINYASFILLKPSLYISNFWLLFLLSGILLAAIYAFVSKNGVRPMMWRGGVSFALGSLIGPVIGNSLGNNSIFASYIITFSVIGVILGVFLGWGVWSGRKDMSF